MDVKKEIKEPPLEKQGEGRVSIRCNGLVFSLEGARRFVLPFGFPYSLVIRRRRW